MPDFATLLLAIVLALTVWWIAINQENPLIVQDFQDRVPVAVVGLGQDQIVVEDLSAETVRLRLRAPRNAWQDLDVTDFRATLDLTGLGPGQNDVPVTVKSLDPQVTIVDVQRPILRVTLDTLAAREVPVQVEIMDGSAFGYDPQPAVYSPVTVTVTGPASQVQEVAKARTQVYLRGAKNQVESMQEVQPVNAQNQPVARVTAEPSLVQVVVPIEQWPGRKEVAVRVKLAGRPADGYRLSSVKVEPSTVVLEGDSTPLAEVPGYVETEPLTLDGATADVKLRLKLLLPEGVTSVDGDQVLATAGVTAIEGGVTVSQPLIQQGLGPTLVATAALPDVDVILSGPVPLLDALNQDDLFVILDLTGLLPGTHAIKPKVVLPDGINLQTVIPETVEVVITTDASQGPESPLQPTGIRPSLGNPAGVLPEPGATPTVTPLRADTPGTGTPAAPLNGASPLTVTATNGVLTPTTPAPTRVGSPVGTPTRTVTGTLTPAAQQP